MQDKQNATLTCHANMGEEAKTNRLLIVTLQRQKESMQFKPICKQYAFPFHHIPALLQFQKKTVHIILLSKLY